jgi:nucleoside-diphosphate-sugar epimerase
MTSSPLRARRVVITGATGFLGSHLLRRLHGGGVEVHAVSRSDQTHQAPQAARWWRADMADPLDVHRVLDSTRPDVVYHLSGLSTGVPDRAFVLPTLHSLLVSTVNVLAAARELGGCRVVLAASLTEPEAGRTEPVPGSPYAAAKWAAGGYARMFHGLYGLPVVMVRPFMTYGPGQDPRKIVPYIIRSLLDGQAPQLSSGTQRFDWIYVDDVVEGLIAAGHAADVEGSTIDLGSGTTVAVHDVAERIVRVIGTTVRPLFGARPDRPLEWVRTADVGGARDKLGWTPSVSLDSGLQRTVEWFREVRARDVVETR